MKKMLDMFRRYSIYRVGQGLRGRVHKISIVAGGEVSIVIRCGMDEPRARHLAQGSLVEFFEAREGVPPKEYVEGKPGQLVTLEPHQEPSVPTAERVISAELHPMGVFLNPVPPDGLVERRVEVPWSGDGPVVEMGRVSDTGKPTDDTQ